MGTETLNSFTSSGITLSAAGADNAPFTITAAGTIRTAGSFGLYSALTATTLINAGVIAGASRDAVVFSGSGANLLDNTGRISAGTAAYHAAAGNGVSISHALLIEAAGTITGGAGYTGSNIGGAGGDGIFVGSLATVSNGVTGVAAGNTITGGAGGAYTAPNGGGGSSSPGRGGAGAYLAGGAVLGNAGAITGGQGGGTPTSNASGYGGYGAALASGATLFNTGTISGGGSDGTGGIGANLLAGANLTNASAGVILGGAGDPVGGAYGGIGAYIRTSSTVSGGIPSLLSAASLTNLGHIAGGAGGYATGGGNGGNGGKGVQVGDLASFTNAGTITGGAGGQGSAAGGFGGEGVLLGKPQNGIGATLVNLKTIIGGAGGAGAGGYGGDGVDAFDTANTIINQGDILGAAGGYADSGVSGGGGDGIYISGGTVVNATLAVIAGANAGATGPDASGKGDVNSVGIYLKSGTIFNAGTIIGGGNGAGQADAVGLGANATLIVAPTAIFNGNVAGQYGAGDMIELTGTSATGLTGLGSQFDGFDTLAFGALASWKVAGSMAAFGAASISGFNARDSLDVTNLGFVQRESLQLGASDVLAVQQGAAVLDVTFSASDTGVFFTISSDGSGGTEITTDLPCFAAGTRLLGVHGPVRVEDIRPGDALVTVREGGPISRKVVWTGSRNVDVARHPEPALVRPVRIRAGAIAPGVPERDLRVSPRHALYLEGCLVEAACLVNGASIIQEAVSRVTYHHVELDGHDILLAEGCPAESFLDTGNRTMFAGADVTVLHPVWQTADHETGCTPRLAEGEKLAKIRALIDARAKQFFFEKKNQKTFAPLHHAG